MEPPSLATPFAQPLPFLSNSLRCEQKPNHQNTGTLGYLIRLSDRSMHTLMHRCSNLPRQLPPLCAKEQITKTPEHLHPSWESYLTESAPCEQSSSCSGQQQTHRSSKLYLAIEAARSSQIITLGNARRNLTSYPFLDWRAEVSLAVL